MHFLKAWPRLEQKIGSFWDIDRLQVFMNRESRRPALIADDAASALPRVCKALPEQKSKILDYGSRVANKEFQILGAKVPSGPAWPWHSDWRYDHTWKASFFRFYDYYEPRKKSYDVKMPWELSRFGFLIPMLQNGVLDGDGSCAHTAKDILMDWEKSNPLAYSVNWHPMEASMRGINLVLALQMLLALGEKRPEVLIPFLRQITNHGEFVSRTVEYSDVRGNHYAANLVALLLFGLVLRDIYPRAQRWLKYGVTALPQECESQFLSDGVDFEKSIAYHRLVTELFLIGIIAMERAGYDCPAKAEERIHAACRYTAFCTRPDGLTPNVGDNDDARVLQFDPVPLRNHSPLLGLGAVFFDDPILKSAAGIMPVAVPWILGGEGVIKWDRLNNKFGSIINYFPEGGVVTARDNTNFLWMDIGEVGMNGRGGHGHNDLMSFELMLDNVPLVVDPGCPVYTGDHGQHDLFRSTAYHNGLRIDGVEIAPFLGVWRIGNDAFPENVEVHEGEADVTVQVSHGGYRRLSDPVTHSRRIRFDAQSGALQCADYLDCCGQHISERFLHFDPQIDMLLEGHQLTLRANQGEWIVSWQEHTRARIEEGLVSPGYGITHRGEILILADDVCGATELFYSINPK